MSLCPTLLCFVPLSPCSRELADTGAQVHTSTGTCSSSAWRCRWIERFNAKLREAAKKDEKRRFKEFVEVAYSKDPRVQQHREEERAQRCSTPCTHCTPPPA